MVTAHSTHLTTAIMDTSITLHWTPVVTSQYGPTNKHTVVSAYIRCEWLWKLMGHTIYHCTWLIPPFLNGIESTQYLLYYWTINKQQFVPDMR